MTRPLGIEFPDALYHITTRGNAQQDIYLSDFDRSNFLEVLARTVEELGWRCHAFCLMTNHYHILIETPRADLSEGMRQINGRYTQLSNRKHMRTGHIFQGRFHAILVELSRYIVLNPVRAGIVDTPSQWSWSSFLPTASEARSLDFLTTCFVLGMFSGDPVMARKAYVKFVLDGIGKTVWQRLRGGVLLGSDHFADKIEPLLKGKAETNGIPRYQIQAVKMPLEQIFQNPAKSSNELIRFAYFAQGYRQRDLAEFLKLGQSRISQVIRAGVGDC